MDSTPQRGARPAVVALLVFAVVDLISTVLLIGRLEYRITVVTHGSPDLAAPALAYQLFDHVLDAFGWGPYGADLVRERAWVLALIVAVTAVAVWRYRARGAARIGRATLGWLGASALVLAVSGLHDAIGPDRRPIAYPLWTLSTLVLVTTAVRLTRTIRRTDHT